MNVILSTVHLLLLLYETPVFFPCVCTLMIYVYIVCISTYTYIDKILEYIKCDLVQIIPDEKTRSTT